MWRKNEWVLVLVLLALAGALYVATRPGAVRPLSEAAYVVATVDGAQVLRLTPQAQGDFDVPGADGAHNRLTVAGRSVRMAQANCPDQWCVRKGAIGGVGDVIVCLPHKLIVRWVDEGMDVDAPDVVMQ